MTRRGRRRHDGRREEFKLENRTGGQQGWGLGQPQRDDDYTELNTAGCELDSEGSRLTRSRGWPWSQVEGGSSVGVHSSQVIALLRPEAQRVCVVIGVVDLKWGGIRCDDDLSDRRSCRHDTPMLSWSSCPLPRHPAPVQTGTRRRFAKSLTRG
eukprot:2558723-Rhodomonas_salina.1